MAAEPAPPGFTGAPIDRADRLRNDPAALVALRADANARLLLLDGLDPVAGEDGLLAWARLDEAPPGVELAFLGLAGGEPRFAALTGASGNQRSPLLFRLLDEWPASEAATYAAARSLVDWHARHGFCANCGAPTEAFRAGWARRCPRCHAEHFPRTDPVVIMLAEHAGRVLVGRQASWPPGRYSALAGFLELGESIEEAVARELEEEVGVRVTNVRYLASQPWPFPSQLMIACLATAPDSALRIDSSEIEHAFWADRAGVAAALAGDEGAPFRAPPHYAIAHTLFERWLAGYPSPAFAGEEGARAAGG